MIRDLHFEDPPRPTLPFAANGFPGVHVDPKAQGTAVGDSNNSYFLQRIGSTKSQQGSDFTPSPNGQQPNATTGSLLGTSSPEFPSSNPRTVSTRPLGPRTQHRSPGRWGTAGTSALGGNGKEIVSSAMQQVSSDEKGLSSSDDNGATSRKRPAPPDLRDYSPDIDPTQNNSAYRRTLDFEDDDEGDAMPSPINATPPPPSAQYLAGAFGGDYSSGDAIPRFGDSDSDDGLHLQTILQEEDYDDDEPLCERDGSGEQEAYEEDVLPGRVLFEYSRSEDLGAGSFGTVVKATYDEDGKTYCIKTAKKAATGVELQGRLQEVYALAVCNSPYIVRYFDAWIENGRVVIKTEYANGGAISKRPKPWGEEDLWQLLLQAGMGLQSMHHANVCHLDIKPDNIVVNVDEETGKAAYKIADFGLARPIEAHSPIGEHFAGLNDDEGDCRYICPEFLARGRVEYVVEADIYSLGATLVELAGGSPKQVRAEGTTTFGRDYSPMFIQVLASMMHADPTERPSSFDVLCTAATAVNQLDPAGELSDPSLQSLAGAYQGEITALQAEYDRLVAAA